MTLKSRVKSKAFNAGLAMRRKVLGEDYVEKAFRSADEFSAPFQEVATEFAWGSVWTRPGLSLRNFRMFPLRSEKPILFKAPQRRVDRSTRQPGDVDDVKPVKVPTTYRLQDDGRCIREKSFAHSIHS